MQKVPLISAFREILVPSGRPYVIAPIQAGEMDENGDARLAARHGEMSAALQIFLRHARVPG